jgi:membrane associated rhomboid family serine protease
MIPISDSTRSRSFPYVNVALIVINVLIFFYELYLNGQTSGEIVGRFRLPTELDVFIFEWGHIPPCTFDAYGFDRAIAESEACREQPSPMWTPLTSMFMHGGWAHLLGNMLFLWIFGDNIEDAIGHVRYLAFYLIGGFLAALAHGIVNVDELTPAVGASGAIAAVLGAYIVLFPRANVVAIIPPLFFFPLPVPAFVMIGIWFLFELISGFSSLGPGVTDAGGGIAYFAHIGGFVAGAALIKAFTIGRPRRQPPEWRRRIDREYW